MERLDKVIASQGKYSRSEVKKLISKKKVIVNGKIAEKSDMKIDEKNTVIEIDGEKVSTEKYAYLMLNKPEGYISSTEDKSALTVLDLLPEEYSKRDFFPAGRLDKDTTGLMIITNDGKLAHNILSPKKHVKKVYDVTIDIDVTEDMVKRFAEGIKLNDFQCKKAKLIITGKNTARVIITEGRYHQIKRMFGCCKAKVTKLHRIGMGNLVLPEDLAEGSYRELSDEELLSLQEKDEK